MGVRILDGVNEMRPNGKKIHLSFSNGPFIYTSTGTILKVSLVSTCTVAHDTKVSCVSIHVVLDETKSIIYISTGSILGIAGNSEYCTKTGFEN